MTDQKLAGKITLLFDRDEGLTIEVGDAVSGLRILDVTVDVPGTVALLSRQAYVDGVIALYQTIDGPIGFVREVKTELVDATGLGALLFESAERYARTWHRLQKYCVDGWTPTRGYGSSSDLRNHHQRVEAKGRADRDKTIYRVHFHRYVDPRTGNPWTWPDDQPKRETETDVTQGVQTNG